MHFFFFFLFFFFLKKESEREKFAKDLNVRARLSK